MEDALETNSAAHWGWRVIFGMMCSRGTCEEAAGLVIGEFGTLHIDLQFMTDVGVSQDIGQQGNANVQGANAPGWSCIKAGTKFTEYEAWQGQADGAFVWLRRLLGALRAPGGAL